MSYNSRLFKGPRLREIVEITDEISNQCETLSDALSAYEQAGDEEDPTEAREQARGEAWEAMGEIVAYADELRQRMERMQEEAR